MAGIGAYANVVVGPLEYEYWQASGCRFAVPVTVGGREERRFHGSTPKEALDKARAFARVLREAQERIKAAERVALNLELRT